MRKDTGGDILAALDFEIPDFDKVSTDYQFALALALTFLLMQLVILTGLVVFLIWGLWVMVVDFPRSPILCFWGLIADAVVLLFLLKPLILRPQKASDERDRAVSREDEPLLYDFVTKLSERLGTKPPEVIRLTIDANASASLPNLFTQRMELWLGLPLLSAFPLRILVAILGHELGHFRQSGTMRLLSLISLIQRFIRRVLYQRDAVDAFLTKLQSVRNIYFKFTRWIIIIAVESMRGLLWLLVVGGLYVVRRMYRQMEFDADRLAAKITGRDEMVKTLEALHFVGIGAQQAIEDAGASLQERALPDDMVRLAVANALSMARYKDEIFENMHQAETNWLSSHPCLRERIENIRDIDHLPSVPIDVPSTRLLANFRATSRRLTHEFYDQRLGELRKRFAVIDAKTLAADRIESRRGKADVRRYFRTGVGPSRRMLPTPGILKRSENIAAALEQLREIRKTVLAMQEQLDIQSGPELEQLTRNRTTYRGHINAIEKLLTVVRRVNPYASLGAIKRWRKHLLRRAAETETRLSELGELIGRLDTLSQRRLQLVMSLLHSPIPMKPGVNISRMRSRAAAIARRAQAIEPVAGLVVQMRERVNTLEVFCRNFPPAFRRALTESIHLTAKALVNDVTEFCHEFSTRPELVKMAKEQAAIGRILPMAVTDPNNLGSLRQSAVAAWDYLNPIIEKLQAKTAGLAEDVESALGLDILPEPPRELESRREEYRLKALKQERRYWLSNGLRAAGGLAVLIFIIYLVTHVIAR
jgi:Zn-dependent protease with chaperone function